MATSKSYTPITDGEIDVDSPLDETLQMKFRDNTVNAQERIGVPGTYDATVENHDHDGVNSAPVGGAVRNVALTGGCLNCPGFGSHSGVGGGTNVWATLVTYGVFVPSGVAYVRAAVNLKSLNIGTTAYARLKLQGATNTEYSNEESVTGTTFAIKDLAVAVPAGGPYNPGQYYSLSLEAKSDATPFGMDAVVEDDATLSGVSLIAAKYFSHAATGGI